jgi:hypothetical protein
MAKKVIKKPTKKIAKKVVKKPAKKIVKKPAKKMVKKVVQKKKVTSFSKKSPVRTAFASATRFASTAVKTVRKNIPSQATVNATAKDIAKTVTVETAGVRHTVAAAAGALFAAGAELAGNIEEGVREGLDEEDGTVHHVAE